MRRLIPGFIKTTRGKSFTQVASILGSNYTFWGDFNNDGWLDIHMNNDGCCPRFAINEGGTGQFSAFEIGNFGNTASWGVPWEFLTVTAF